VSSIGGRIGVPHLAPYCASKFALVGLSQSLAAELRRESIRVTVVCPGLMRTGSHGAAMFRGQHDKEFAWFAAMDSVPLLSVRAARAARIIIESCREGQALVTFPWHWRVADIGAQVLPNLTAFANGVFARFLPGPAENGGPLLPGRKSRTGRLRSWLTRLADQRRPRKQRADSLRRRAEGLASGIQ
jgi:NAD(P)-dependent dehydrogenase (short-subunit alcohol dehydrogenase family)